MKSSLRAAVVATSVFMTAGTAQAALFNYTLHDVVFADGATAVGEFTYDSATNNASQWDFTYTPGAGTSWTGFWGHTGPGGAIQERAPATVFNSGLPGAFEINTGATLLYYANADRAGSLDAAGVVAISFGISGNYANTVGDQPSVPIGSRFGDSTSSVYYSPTGFGTSGAWLMTGISSSDASADPTPAPEPAAMAVLGMELAGIAAPRRRRGTDPVSDGARL